MFICEYSMIYKRPSNFSLYGSLKVLYQKYTCIILTVRRLRATFSHLIYSTGDQCSRNEYYLLFVFLECLVSTSRDQGSVVPDTANTGGKMFPAPRDLVVSPLRNEKGRSSQQMEKHKTVKRQKQHSNVVLPHQLPK